MEEMTPLRKLETNVRKIEEERTLLRAMIGDGMNRSSSLHLDNIDLGIEAEISQAPS